MKFLSTPIDLRTLALKMVSEPFAMVCMDLRVEGIEDSTRQTIETHCPLLSESPTNISLLFLSLSSNLVALNLINIKTETNLKNNKHIYTIQIINTTSIPKYMTLFENSFMSFYGILLKNLKFS